MHVWERCGPQTGTVVSAPGGALVGLPHTEAAAVATTCHCRLTSGTLCSMASSCTRSAAASSRPPSLARQIKRATISFSHAASSSAPSLSQDAIHFMHRSKLAGQMWWCNRHLEAWCTRMHCSRARMLVACATARPVYFPSANRICSQVIRTTCQREAITVMSWPPHLSMLRTASAIRGSRPSGSSSPC